MIWSRTDNRTIETALRRGAAAARPGEPNARAATAGRRESRHAAEAAARLTRRIADEGLADVTYAPAESPFGTLLLAATSRGLVRVAFPEESPDTMLEGLARRISPRIVEARAARTEEPHNFEQAAEAFLALLLAHGSRYAFINPGTGSLSRAVR